MTGIQKVIKYIAIALAIFIIINICGGILFGLSIVAGIFQIRNESDSMLIDEVQEKVQIEKITQMSNLDIDIKYSKLNIKTGDTFKVESNNTHISCKENGNDIEIKEKGNMLFSLNKESILTIYVPANVVFNNINIETGAGRVDIESLKAEILELEIGAGAVEIEELNIKEKAKIEGGAGSILINSGTINNLKLNTGVGKTEINAEILGNSKINAGIGKLDINLIGEQEDYLINTENGIGVININGDKVGNNTKFGNGKNVLKVNGGIGAIDIRFNI